MARPARVLLSKLVVVSTLFLIPCAAYASPPAVDDADDDARAYRGKTSRGVAAFEYEDDEIAGSRLGPPGENALARRFSQQASLISIRQHFIPVMIDLSAELAR